MYLIAAMSGWALLCRRCIQLDDMPFPVGTPASLDQTVCLIQRQSRRVILADAA
jgi:hypothetical protein